MWHLYLDESGDLGFDFANRKSSDVLTITVLATSSRETVDRYFYRQVADCEFGLYAVTLDKRKVLLELSEDSAVKLRIYNYLARQVLERIPLQEAGDVVELIVDKSKGAWEVAEFNDYVQSHLKGRIDPRVAVKIYHHDSMASAGLSAVDLFCWGIFRKHERNDVEWYSVYREKVIEDARYP